MLHTNFAVFIGIVYAYLPFMVLPLYTNLVKLDASYLEAAADLGAKPWKTFIFVTLPLTKGGIIAGSMLVFIPAITMRSPSGCRSQVPVSYRPERTRSVESTSNSGWVRTRATMRESTSLPPFQ